MSISLATAMSLSADSVRTKRNTDNLLALKDQMTDLQRQLATGSLSETYSGLGADAGKALSLEKTLSRYDDFAAANKDATLRLKLMDTALSAINKEATTVSAAAKISNVSAVQANGLTTAQQTAQAAMQTVIDQLNSDAAGRYLFSGRATDTQPVQTYDTIINGTSTQAGLKQIVAERKAADDTNGQGNVTVAAAANVVTVTNASATRGIQIGTPGSQTSSITVAAAAGGGTLTVGTQPQDGDVVQLSLTFPDGTTKTLAFTARTGTADAAKGEYQIGSGTTQTASALAGVVTSVLQTEAATDLKAASAMRAANDFFGATPASPYVRLSATPSPAGTVQWYQGDTTSPNARDTAIVQVDANQSVSVGAQANEQAFRTLMAQLGVLATETFSSTSTTDPARYQAMIARATPNASSTSSSAQSLVDVQTQLGLASATIKSAQTNNTARANTLKDALSSIEDADPTTVAVQLSDLQTRLQASYQLTSSLSKMSLVNYL